MKTPYRKVKPLTGTQMLNEISINAAQLNTWIAHFQHFKNTHPKATFEELLNFAFHASSKQGLTISKNKVRKLLLKRPTP